MDIKSLACPPSVVVGRTSVDDGLPGTHSSLSRWGCASVSIEPNLTSDMAAGELIARCPLFAWPRVGRLIHTPVPRLLSRGSKRSL